MRSRAGRGRTGVAALVAWASASLLIYEKSEHLPPILNRYLQETGTNTKYQRELVCTESRAIVDVLFQHSRLRGGCGAVGRGGGSHRVSQFDRRRLNFSLRISLSFHHSNSRIFLHPPHYSWFFFLMAVQDSCRYGSAILRLLRLAATFNDDVMLALKMTYLPCNGETLAALEQHPRFLTNQHPGLTRAR